MGKNTDPSSGGLPRVGRLYMGAVIVVGLIVISDSVRHVYREPVGPQWFLLAALTLISGSATVVVSSSYASITVSEAFVFTAVLLYGPPAGTVLVTVDALMISFWLAKRHPEPSRALFNISAPAISAWCSAHLFFKVAGIPPIGVQAAGLPQLLPGLMIFALVYFGINSWLIAFIIALERRMPPVTVWRHNFPWLSLNYFCGASVAALFVSYSRQVDVLSLALIVPLLVVLYLAFKASGARVEDANRHIVQLNRLYLSTIQTLAMAVDAKDQVTHGHVRRVQAYAVGLARRSGIQDEQQFKAIEAAALLHDVGKLAVPEHILNKPGKLTSAEFAKMKLHAGVGADILSAVDFPYPVVPIVRHHHESWDGTGYPDGLRGTDIPLGARILSVVDCFDALTSDRPYRPRFTNEAALKIVTDRSGTMYDPLIVDTFIRMYSEMTIELSAGSSQRPALKEIRRASASAPTPSDPPLGVDKLSANEIPGVDELMRLVSGLASMNRRQGESLPPLGSSLPVSLGVLYRYDPSADVLEAVHAIGQAHERVKGLRIALGSGVSGWVAATRQTILNVDAVLDLSEVGPSVTAHLRSCLSTPVSAADVLFGVLTLYSEEPAPFTEEHHRVVAAVAHQIAERLKHAADS